MQQALEIFWQGAALAVVVVALVALGAFGAWRAAWWRPRWEEAWRDGHRLHMRLERWIRFRWIHPDCRYWILHTRLDRGPVLVEGAAPPGLWWDLTWVAWTEANGSVSSDAARLDASGRYRIVLSPDRRDADGADWIEVRPGVGRAVLVLRVYLPSGPAVLPRVCCAEREIVPECAE